MPSGEATETLPKRPEIRSVFDSRMDKFRDFGGIDHRCCIFEFDRQRFSVPVEVDHHTGRDFT